MDDPKKKFQRLTQRERDVLDLWCQGKSQKEMALELGIGTDGIKSHLNHIYQKLELMHISPRERGFILRDEYWPFVLSEPLEVNSEPELEVFDPEPTNFEETISKDQKVIKALVAVEDPPSRKAGGISLPCSGLVIAGLLGLAALIFFVLDGAGFTRGFLVSLSSSVTTVPTQEATSVQVPTAVPNTASLTSAPSETEPPTQTSTETVTASATLSQTPRPSPTFDFGEIYETGEWHKEGDVWFRLFEASIEYDGVYIFVEAWNQSNQPIYFNWTTIQNTQLRDNMGNKYELIGRYELDDNDQTIPAQTKMIVYSGASPETVVFRPEPLFQAGVTELYFTLEYFSRIERATWVFYISK